MGLFIILKERQKRTSFLNKKRDHLSHFRTIINRRATNKNLLKALEIMKRLSKIYVKYATFYTTDDYEILWKTICLLRNGKAI